MVSKCANPVCVAPFRYMHEGKLFRLDIDLGNITGERQRKTEYLWLCSECARSMRPKVELMGDSVQVRLYSSYAPSTRAFTANASAKLN